VLSFPRAELTPPAVATVPSPEDAPWEGAASEFAISVDIVGAADLSPIVVRGCPSSDTATECLLRFNDDVLAVRPVGTVEKDMRFPFAGPAELPFTVPDSGYGLLFFDASCFLSFVFE
jgi:hypothetical protein